MSEAKDLLAGAAVVGIAATSFMDLCALVQKRVFGVRPLDYRLLGRWIARLSVGSVGGEPITALPRVTGETAIGWGAHYLIGIVLALVLLWIWGTGWVHHPALVPAIIVGIGSIVLPVFILQPAMGAGIAASRTPNPWIARLRSFGTHATFALGLYVGGWIAARVLGTG